MMARMTGDDIGGEGGADHIHMTAPTTHVRKTTEWWPRRRGAASLTRTAEDPRWWWTGTPPPFPPAEIERNRKNYVHEIETLCQLRHKNLLRLIGWCDDGGRLLLVYELQPNGSVSDHLHGGKTPLTWPQRYGILLGIASAVEYLHTGAYDSATRYVLHRDIKPSNVMLGEGFQAKLGDFGLVRQVTRHGGGGGTPRTTVIGSMDYMDPKYMETGALNPASDIYSFGVLLLEVVTGAKPSVPRGTLPGCGDQNSLVGAVRECHGRNAILGMTDERLREEFEQWQWQIERVMVTGLMCVRPEREDRPSIKDIISLLSKLEPLPTPTTT
ncbi:hypothetical protein QYE76_038281 [Lolium multiflorum]|uniref:Protein kinase domain-containing protein n=1 Tax=Lolium multiflorum TaxID=4521 RepID=A0AAD8WTG2_LOLMU|nr:hypothetical protein QYE76_038281 [Lolium multiflorum]